MTPERLNELTYQVLQNLKQDFAEHPLFCLGTAELSLYRLRDTIHLALLQESDQ